jgi:hypothetical protein
MPYDESKKMINTKLVEVVNRKSESGNIMQTRQDLLRMLYLTPEVCRHMYIQNDEAGMKEVVLITHDTEVKYSLGLIQSKYYDMLNKSYYKIMSWRITGGQNLGERNGRMVKAYFGMNICIQIVAEKKEPVLQPANEEDEQF